MKYLLLFLALAVSKASASPISGELGLQNAPTATALATNGANCSSGKFPLGVDASGVAESCTSTLDTTTEISTMTVKGNAFSVGGSTFVVSGGVVTAGGALKWGDSKYLSVGSQFYGWGGSATNILYSGGSGGLNINNQADNTVLVKVTDARRHRDGEPFVRSRRYRHRRHPDFY